MYHRFKEAPDEWPAVPADEAALPYQPGEMPYTLFVIRDMDAAAIRASATLTNPADLAGLAAIRQILYAMMIADPSEVQHCCDAARRHLVVMEQARRAREGQGTE